VYGRVLRAPHVRALVAFSVVARVPLGITSIALVLFVKQQTGSFAWAGVVTATFALSSAILGVAMSRLIDRHGQTLVLLGGMTVYCAAVGGIVALGLAGAPIGALIACAVAAGAQPPVSTCLRPLWPQLLADERSLLPTAYALDALLIEAVFVAGPLLTGLLVALFSPQVALLVGLAFIATGVLGFSSQEPSRRWRGEGREHGGLIGALRSPGLQTLTAAAFGIGSCFGAIEVAFAAYGTSRHTSALAGVLIALNATGSALGGLWYGANAHRLGPVQRAYVLLVCSFGPLMALIAAAPTLGFVIAMAVISGMATAPLTTAQNLLVGELAPRGRVTESFTWLVTALVVGIATGNAAAGALTDVSSWRIAVLAAATLAGVAALVTVLRRRTLAPASG
jgi:MFS family permease